MSRVVLRGRGPASGRRTRQNGLAVLLLVVLADAAEPDCTRGLIAEAIVADRWVAAPEVRRAAPRAADSLFPQVSASQRADLRRPPCRPRTPSS
jgi:hypothetical protein